MLCVGLCETDSRKCVVFTLIVAFSARKLWVKRAEARKGKYLTLVKLGHHLDPPGL